MTENNRQFIRYEAELALEELSLDATDAIIEAAIDNNYALAAHLRRAGCKHDLAKWQQSVLAVQRAVGEGAKHEN
jgi:hypothetical protein